MAATAPEKTERKEKITAKTTIANIESGTKASIRKIASNSKDRKFLQDRGMDVGTDLVILGSDQGGITVEYNCGRRELIPTALAEVVYLSQPLERHLDPMISGGCCTYGNTAGALDMMNEINDKTFG